MMMRYLFEIFFYSNYEIGIKWILNYDKDLNIDFIYLSKRNNYILWISYIYLIDLNFELFL